MLQFAWMYAACSPSRSEQRSFAIVFAYAWSKTKFPLPSRRQNLTSCITKEFPSQATFWIWRPTLKLSRNVVLFTLTKTSASVKDGKPPKTTSVKILSSARKLKKPFGDWQIPSRFFRASILAKMKAFKTKNKIDYKKPTKPGFLYLKQDE